MDRYDAGSGAFVGQVVAPNAAAGGFGGMKFGPDGNLYVCGIGSGTVYKYNGTTGAYMSDFITGLSSPRDIIFASFDAPSVSIGNLVWNDTNNNGVRDAGVSLASRVRPFKLYTPGADNAIGGAGANADNQVGVSVVTSATGGYAFTKLPPGKYFVKVTPPVSYPMTSGIPVTADNGVDSDNNGSQPGGIGTPLYSPVITLAPALNRQLMATPTPPPITPWTSDCSPASPLGISSGMIRTTTV